MTLSAESVRAELRQTLADEPDERLRRFARSYAATVAPFLLALALHSWIESIATAVLAAVIAGLVQNGLLVLMHEGSHYFFHPNRSTNDRLADFLVCLPILNSVSVYRASHLEHHREVGTERDPYYELYAPPSSRWRLGAGIASDLVGLTALRLFLARHGSRSAEVERPAYTIPGLLMVQAILWGGIYAATGSALAYFYLWLAPLAAIPIAINRIRTVAEHMPGAAGLEANRTTVPGLVDYLCIAPYGYAYHFEHHLAPDIPYYRLSWAHRQLIERGVVLSSSELNRSGFLRTFWHLGFGRERPS